MCASQASPLAALAPVFQEAVHVEVRDQRTDDAALRHAHLVGLSARHARPAILAGRLDRRLEPLFDQPQHVGIDNAASHRTHQLSVWDGIEILAQIGIDHVGVALPKQGQHLLDRLTPRHVSAGSRTRPGPGPPQRLAPVPVSPRSAPPGPGLSGYRAAARRRRASGSSPAAPAGTDTSLSVVPRPAGSASSPTPSSRSVRT